MNIFTPELIAVLLGVVVYGVWEIIKAATKTSPDARLITTINGVIAVIYAVVVSILFKRDVFELIVLGGAVFASGSLFDLLKAYGAVQKSDRE